MSRAVKSATDLEKVFAQALEMPAGEVVKLFEFYEEEDFLVAASRGWLGREVFLKAAEITRQLGGAYQFSADKKRALFKVPKPREAVSNAPAEPIISTPSPRSPIGPVGAEKPETPPPPIVKHWEPEYPPADAPVTPGYYAEFPVDRILSPKLNFRADVAEGASDLMEEIHVAGMIIEPLVCRPATKPGYVERGPGERRLYAARQLGMKTVPIIVKAMDDLEFDKVRLLENLARRDLSAMELARVLKYFMDKYPQKYPTQEILAKAVNKTPGWISQHLNMLQLEEPEKLSIFTRVNLKPEKLTEGQAREILASPPEKREEVAKAIADHIKAEGKPPSMQDIRKITEPGERAKCARCGNPTMHPVMVDGLNYCQSCSGMVQAGKAKPPKEDHVTESVTSKPKEEKPEGEDIAEVTCPICKTIFRLVHHASDNHQAEYYMAGGKE